MGSCLLCGGVQWRGSNSDLCQDIKQAFPTDLNLIFTVFIIMNLLCVHPVAYLLIITCTRLYMGAYDLSNALSRPK